VVGLGADEIKKRTSGRYDIQVFPASTLGKETDINQGLTLGTVDIIISGASFRRAQFPRLGVGYYPYTFRDADHLLKYAQSDVFRELADGYKRDRHPDDGGDVLRRAPRHQQQGLKTCDEMKG